MTTKLSTIPVELQDVHRDFERWRRTRQAGACIPASLWASAVAVARRHGVYRTARALHLEARKLKHLAAASPVPRASTGPAFVELLAPVAGGSGEGTIEIDGPRGGRLRVQFRGVPVPDLVALARVLWSSEA